MKVKKEIQSAISVLGYTIGCLSIIFGLFFGKIMNLDVKAIPAEYDSESELLQYDGKTYHMIEMNDASYGHNPDLELLGRIKGSGMLLYCYKNDSDKSIILGDVLDIGYIFSDRYSEIPTDGEVTNVYVDLQQRRETESGTYHTLVKSEYLRDVEDVDLFESLWEERHKNEPLTFVNSQVVDELDNISVRFCFEECPAAGARNHIIFYNNEWYLVDTQYEYVDGQHIQKDYCYLIANEELIKYLTKFIKYEGNTEE